MSQHDPWDFAGGLSESYERFQVPGVFEPLARMVLERIALKPGQRVLDVACGTGIVARLAAPIVGAEGEVVGVDLSTDMLKVAAQQAPSAGLQITWRQGDASALPFADGTFDVVLCQQGLQFFPDVEATVVTRRMLAPEISIPEDLASTPLRPEIAALDKSKRNELVEEISAALHAYRTAVGFAIPQGTHIALAAKPREASA